MRRVFADLHLCMDVAESSEVVRLGKKAFMLGYGLAAVPFAIGTSEEQINATKALFSEFRVDLASRVDLRPETSEQLLKDLRKLRRRFEVIAVLCVSRAVARQAAKDRRVDLLNFPQPDFRRAFFDAAEAELAAVGGAFLEIDMKALLVLEGAAKIRHLSMLRRQVQTAREFHVPIVVSSGVSGELLMRKPLELACLGSLIGIRGEFAADSISKIPVGLVKRNREKLSWRFVAPGIRVVRRGRDC